MFASHFALVTTREDVESKWHVWRAYDIAMRKKVKWPEPPYIGDFDMATYQNCVSNTPLEAPHAQGQTSCARSLAHTSGSSSMNTSGSGSAQAPKYDRCIICGNHAHRFDKSKKTPLACAPAWLVWNTDKRYYTICSSGGPVCYGWNSVAKCRRDTCRFSTTGHICSLCGANDHGTCQCAVVPC